MIANKLRWWITVVRENVGAFSLKIVGLLICLGAGFLAPIAKVVAEEEVPTGDEVIQRFIDVSGGLEAYTKIQNRVILAKLYLADHGWEGELVELFVPPDYRRIIVIDNFDPVIHGLNNGDAWQRTPLGPRNPLGQGRDLADVKAADLKLLGQLNPFLDWNSGSGKAKIKREVNIEGDDCFRVEVTLLNGDIVHADFSKETGLLHGLDNFTANLFRYYDDYRVHDGVLIPHKVHIAAGMIMMDLEFLRIEQNVDLTELSVDEFFQTIEKKDISEILGVAEDGSLQEPLK